MIIAGAGGAAHLPGMVAALTPLPVVGVPVVPAGAQLGGIDALLSIVQAGPTLIIFTTSIFCLCIGARMRCRKVLEVHGGLDACFVRTR